MTAEPQEDGFRDSESLVTVPPHRGKRRPIQPRRQAHARAGSRRSSRRGAVRAGGHAQTLAQV